MTDPKQLVRQIITVCLYIIEGAILLPFVDSGLNAMNQQSTVAFIGGLIWCLFVIALFVYIIKTKLNDNIARFIINALNF